MITFYQIFFLIIVAHTSLSSSNEVVEDDGDFWTWLYGEDDGTDKTVDQSETIIDNINKEFQRHYGFFGRIFNKEEIDFQIFNVHDFDANKQLDGLELLSMMAHQHEGHEHSYQTQSRHTYHSKAETLIDMILRTEDANDDGFLDYTEFVSARRKHNNLKVLQI